MQGSANNDVGVLIAPDRLISETRGEFRAAALQQLDELHKDRSAGVLRRPATEREGKVV